MHWSLVYLISEWVIRLTMLVYVPRQRSAAAARTWLLFIFLLPWPGLVFYALVGRIYLPKDRLARQEGASKKIRLVQEQFLARGHALPSLPSNVSPLAALAARLGDFEPLQGNDVELLTDYQGSIQRLIADIEAARGHVHLLNYIFEDDETGRRVAKALAEAAARGVKCRVLLDAVGSKRALRRLAPKMRQDGIEVTALLPAGLFRRNAARFDLRNHRKIVVIDGAIGYSGSQNICDGKFVEGFPNEELVARLAGPVVWQLQAVFLADYYQETTTVLDGMEIFPAPAGTGQSIAQALPSGPGYGRENAQELLIALLYEARERAVLTTPYFVPDEPFLEAMRAAARRGVEVHLVVSEHANQRLTQMAQRSFYDELLEAGVKIHLFAPRFLHAKNLTIDNDVALVGSANIDIRSFALNEEISLLFYDAGTVAALHRVQDAYLAQSALLDAGQWGQR
ncbi:MAG TPA: cardiolipin synthase, partial [Candidatus Acidoferrum sp.]|nr:cardiolipin synthase [Candidatus Acidoferrum sp.]